MTKRQAERYMNLRNAMLTLGFTDADLDALLRCSKVLSTWAEHECNGEIQRDDDTGIPYWHSTYDGKRLSRTADREAGALARAEAICKAHGVELYHQGDPRGCALYIIRKGDVPNGEDVNAYYTRGIAVCID